jgi:small subunit ribosomal protein S2
MRRFIYDSRNGIHVIDLLQTQSGIQNACDYLRTAVRDKKNIVFVGTKKQAVEIVEEEARRCRAFFVNRRWLGGTLTNFETIRLRMLRLNELESMRESGEFYRRPKKELAKLNRELFKLEQSLGGIKNMRGRPDVLIIIDQTRESIAVSEASKVRCTTLGIVDTNCNPDGIDYVIPANDDSRRSIKLITRLLADAIIGDEEKDIFEDDNDDPDAPDNHPSRVPKRPFPGTRSTEIVLSLPNLSGSQWDSDN